MTEKQIQLLQDAVDGLTSQGFQYSDILAFVVKKGPNPVLIQEGRNTFILYYQGSSTTTSDVFLATTIFTSITTRMVSNQPEIVPGNPGEPFELDSEASARMAEELAKNPPAGIKRNPDGR